MKTIVHIVEHLLPGGIESLVLDFIRSSDESHTNHVASLQLTYEDAVKRWGSIKEFDSSLLHFFNKQPGFQLSLILKLRLLFTKLDVDVIHIHGKSGLIYAGPAAYLSKIPKIIYTIHNAWSFESQYSNTTEKLLTKIIKPKLIADAKFVAVKSKDIYPKTTISVIHNGIDTNKFDIGSMPDARKELDLPLEQIIIGCAARLTPIKGHTYLLKAMRELPENISLAFAGDGISLDNLKREAHELGIAPRVYFLGHINSMPSFYQSIDLFCLPSLNEGLPLSILEAQACGKKVVVTNVGGCSEAVCPESGIVVNPMDSYALANAIRIQLRDSSDCNPRTFVLNNRSLQEMISSYRALYD